jgi:hypothetical protein
MFKTLAKKMQVIRRLQKANFIFVGSSELFHIHKASLRTTAFCDVTLCSLIEVTGVSEKCTSSVFRIEECHTGKQKDKDGGNIDSIGF